LGSALLALLVAGVALAGPAGLLQAAQRDDKAAAESACRVTWRGSGGELRGPTFVFRLSAADGLRAESWENRLTGRRLSLGNGPEIALDLGLPGKPVQTPKLRLVAGPKVTQGDRGEAVFELAGDEPPLSAVVTYRWDAKQPVLRKLVTITNRSGQAWNRLLNVRLGTYQTDAKAETADPDYPAFVESRIDDPAGRARGFPAYVERQFFVGLAHPAGFATRQDRGLALRQLPGAKLAPGASFQCMEAVYGVSREDAVRSAFRDFLLGRMRRVLRGHDKPMAIFEPFGAKPDGDFWETEEFLRDNIAKLAQGQRDSGLHWDYYSIDFWHDPKGDLKTPDSRLFPRGFTGILAELKELGTLPGLWVDSGNVGPWTIAANPAVQRALTPGAVWTKQLGLCRATEPANRFYVEGYVHQLRTNGVRLVKFDNAQLTCSQPNHEHLSGDYSMEPIADALIAFYRELDRQCPDVFIMLYWYYRSPWWLQYADTVFDVGMEMEGASYSLYPTLRPRDSVTRRLDGGRWLLKDWPALGWDPLGVWLSDWPWNSRVGKDAWQGGVIMDISRGHLLAQIWSDTPYLSPAERRQMAEFIAVLKARPECFRNSRFILGNPWKNEPYGYCCADGRRAFLAINNGVWRDSTLTLELNSAWGLPDGKGWDLYRWYPHAAKLGGEHGSQVKIALRPFDIVLLEAVPAGQRPTLDRQFKTEPIAAGFAQPASQRVPITVQRPGLPPQGGAVAWTLLEPAAFRSTGGATLTRLADGSLLAGGENPAQDGYVIQASTTLNTVTAVRLEALADESLPNKGPGRAVNGNFTLAEFRLSAGAQPVRFARARASFSQTSFGGWPVEAAVDGDPKTGWGIDQGQGMSHVAVFELKRPLSCRPGDLLEFRLDHKAGQHSIGRLRLSVTSAKPPIHVPGAERHVVVRGTVPPSPNGGLLAVSDEFRAGTQRYWTRLYNTGITLVGTLGDKPVAFEPVLKQRGASAPWQTWRLAVGPSDVPQPFELHVTCSLPMQHSLSAHYLPVTPAQRVTP
jgi:hypothetical protein